MVVGTIEGIYLIFSRRVSEVTRIINLQVGDVNKPNI
jgi:hypothetical protein